MSFAHLAATFDLSPITPCQRDAALRDIEHGDVVALFERVDVHQYMELLNRNLVALLEQGLLAKGFMVAHRSLGDDCLDWSEAIDWIVRLQAKALRALGDPVPFSGRMSVYRGVWGSGPSRWVRGFSWTMDLGVAAGLARASSISWARSIWPSLETEEMASLLDKARPAIFRTEINDTDVIFFDDSGGEKEVFLNRHALGDVALVAVNPALWNAA